MRLSCAFPTDVIQRPGLNGRGGKAATASKRHRKRRLRSEWKPPLKRLSPRNPGLDGRAGKAATASRRHRKRRLSPHEAVTDT